MRWEMEKTWEFSKRLATWASREKNFNRPADLISYAELVRRFDAGERDMWEKYEQVKVPGQTKPMWKLKSKPKSE